MRTSTWIAIGLLAAVAAWLASGLFIGEEEEEARSAPAPQPTLVEVRPSAAETVPQYIYAQGVAEPYRTVDVVAAAGGTLASVEAQQGRAVEAGEVMARVRLEARESELASARAQVESLEADLAGVRELERQGFATEARVRELQSQLESARAALENVRAEIRDTTIEAPIPGIVSDVFVNGGETVAAGSSVARIVDNAPLRVTINISQRDIGSIDVGREAVASFATGATAKGRVCYVAPAADPETRTFRVEIRVPNEERKIPSVVSTEVRLQTGEAEAHFISPAILALGEAGALGVKAVAPDDMVRFHEVEVVRAGMDGVWVAGLPQELRLITTGQGFVRAGERVRVREEQANGEAAPVSAVGHARLPTATVEQEEFEGAERLPAPPAVDALCRGAAANTVTTSSVPAGSGGSAAPADAGAARQAQPGGNAARAQEGSEGRAGTGPVSGTGGAPSSVGPITPGVPTPPVGAAPAPGGAGQQQGGGGAGGTPAGTGSAAGAGAGAQ